MGGKNLPKLTAQVQNLCKTDINIYALAYRVVRAFFKWIGLCLPFIICARRGL